MANVRKLMRLAREFEAEQGGDLRAFIDHLAEQDVLAAREGEAPLEAEDLHAVRLMTIHAAKGLEFPVVCVADLGRSGKGDDDALRVTDDGRVGLKIASMAGGSAKGLDLEAIEGQQKREQDEEERRIFYVAMTRAQELLVLSGATDTEKWPEPELLGVPMNWVWRGFAPGLDAGEPQGGTLHRLHRRRTWTTCSTAPPATAARSPARTAAVPVAPLKEFERFEAAPALPVGRLSYSGPRALPRVRLPLLPRAGRRAARARAAALARRRSPSRRARTSCRRSCAGRSCTSCSSGSTSRTRPRRARTTSPNGSRPTARRPGPAAVEDTLRFVTAFLGAPLFERLAAARRVRKELAFAYELAPPAAGGRSLLVNGFVDVYAEEPDARADRGLQDRLARGHRRRGAVRRAVLDPAADLRARGAARGRSGGRGRVLLPRAAGGAGHARVDAPRTPPRSSSELLELAAGVIEGRFEPAAEPHLHLCAQCAGRPSLCSWDEAATSRVLDATLDA